MSVIDDFFLTIRNRIVTLYNNKRYLLAFDLITHIKAIGEVLMQKPFFAVINPCFFSTYLAALMKTLNTIFLIMRLKVHETLQINSSNFPLKISLR